MTTRTRRGQALIELAVGLFTLTLIVSALCYFTSYIVKSLRVQNHLRCDSKVVQDKVEVDDFAARYVFGTRNLHVKEPCGTVDRSIP